MKIRYSEKMAARTFGGVPCHFKTDQAVTHLSREACIMAGFTDDELKRAEAAPGTWIECEREEAPPPSVRTESEVIADLTEQRDGLLEACRKAQRLFADSYHPQSITYRFPGFGLTLEAHSAIDAAIARAEPKT